MGCMLGFVLHWLTQVFFLISLAFSFRFCYIYILPDITNEKKIKIHDEFPIFLISQ